MVGRDIYLVLESTAYTYYLYTYSLCSIGPGILFHRFCPQQRTADTYYRSIANPCSSIARYFHYMSNGQMLHLYISYICSDLQGVGSGLKRMLYHCSNYLPPNADCNFDSCLCTLDKIFLGPEPHGGKAR